MASLGAGLGAESFPLCGECGSCLCADARIATLCACRRAAAGERGRWLSWSSQTGALPWEGVCTHWPRVFQFDMAPAWCCALRGGTLTIALRMRFCCFALHDMGKFQDQAVSVSSKCFYFGAVCQLVLSWCWQENIFPLENNPIAFPTCCC